MAKLSMPGPIGAAQVGDITVDGSTASIWSIFDTGGAGNLDDDPPVTFWPAGYDAIPGIIFFPTYAEWLQFHLDLTVAQDPESWGANPDWLDTTGVLSTPNPIAFDTFDLWKADYIVRHGL